MDVIGGRKERQKGQDGMKGRGGKVAKKMEDVKGTN